MGRVPSNGGAKGGDPPPRKGTPSKGGPVKGDFDFAAWVRAAVRGNTLVANFMQDARARHCFGAYCKALSGCSAADVGSWRCGEACPPQCQPLRWLQASAPQWGSADAVAGLVADFGDGIGGVVIRGSHTAVNWLADADIFMTALPYADYGCPGGHSHAGFLNSWAALREPVVQALQQLGLREVVFWGHSLGGGECFLAALQAQHQGWALPRGCITFESPRVFDAAGAACFEATAIPSLRVTNVDDPVVHGPAAFLGFRHAGPEVYLPADRVPRFCATAEAPGCSAGDRVSIDIKRHCELDSYLGLDVCGCWSSDAEDTALTRAEIAALLLGILGAAALVYWMVKKNLAAR
jgi:pimeloyl-ACP methyl ester carboxylesterase